MSVVGNIANQRRIVEQSALDFSINACVNMLANFYVSTYLIDRPHNEIIDQCIDSIVDCWHTVSWSQKTYAKVCLLAAKKAFGDPMSLNNDQLKLRQHANQYYNPTSVWIKVEPMGLPDEYGNVIKEVCPGGLINIPQGYLVGGKRSVVHTTAPQLVPMPRVEWAYNLLDQTPTSYYEWLIYYPATPSPCCNRCIMWSDTNQCLVCEICRKPVFHVYGKRL
jgi:hypothetical protein